MSFNRNVLCLTIATGSAPAASSMHRRFNRNVLCLTVATSVLCDDGKELPVFNRNVLCLTVATTSPPSTINTPMAVQPKCALPDRCDGASIKYVGHRLSCLCLRAPLQLAGLPKRVEQQERRKCLLVAALQRASATALFRSTSPLAVKELSWIRFS